MSIDVSPMNRSWPSESSISLRNVSRHTAGIRNGSSPSSTSKSASAANSVSLTPLPRRADQRPGQRLPAPFMCLKKSALGSSSSTSDLFRKLWRYASMLR